MYFDLNEKYREAFAILPMLIFLFTSLPANNFLENGMILFHRVL